MRDSNDSVNIDSISIREVSYIAGNFSGSQSSFQVSIVDEFSTGKIQDSYAVFHLTDNISIDKALCLVIARNMQSNIIRSSINFFLSSNYFAVSSHFLSGFFAEERVCADNCHTKCICSLSDFLTDCTQSDNTQSLAHSFNTAELALSLFYLSSNICFAVLEFSSPCNSLCYLTGSKENTCNHKFFHSVCICTGRIENNNTLFSALVNRNIICTCTCSADSQQFRTECIIMHLCRTHQNTSRIFYSITDSISGLVE